MTTAVSQAESAGLGKATSKSQLPHQALDQVGASKLLGHVDFRDSVPNIYWFNQVYNLKNEPVHVGDVGDLTSPPTA